jgi:hypothetical protein
MAAAAANQTALAAIEGMTPELLRTTNITINDAYSKSYANVYYFVVAIGVLAIAASVCIRDFDKYLTGHVPRQLYRRMPTPILWRPQRVRMCLLGRTKRLRSRAIENHQVLVWSTSRV